EEDGAQYQDRHGDRQHQDKDVVPVQGVHDGTRSGRPDGRAHADDDRVQPHDGAALADGHQGQGGGHQQGQDDGRSNGLDDARQQQEGEARRQDRDGSAQDEAEDREEEQRPVREALQQVSGGGDDYRQGQEESG